MLGPSSLNWYGRNCSSATISLAVTCILPPHEKIFLAAMIDAKIFKDPVTGRWSCSDCEFTSQHQTNLRNHIEVYHVASQGYFCPVCSKTCKTRNALSIHKSRNKHWNATEINWLIQMRDGLIPCTPLAPQACKRSWCSTWTKFRLLSLSAWSVNTGARRSTTSSTILRPNTWN